MGDVHAADAATTAKSENESHAKPRTQAGAATAHQANIAAATGILSPNDEDHRKGSDVGPRNEASPEQHLTSHHPLTASSTATASDNKAGIDYGNFPHFGVASTSTTTNSASALRRQSLANSPYRGNIHTTVSPPLPARNGLSPWATSGSNSPNRAPTP